MLTDSEYERLIEETLAICAIPAPTFAERDRAEHVAELLREAGLGPSFDAVGNVVAVVVPGEGPLVVEAHLDTVFGLPLPTQPAREGDRLVGAGIGDNSLATATLLLLARRIAASPPRRPLVLAATVGEEGEGDLRGAKALVRATRPSAFVALEGHGIDRLVTGGIGSVRVEATFTAAGGHSWGDRGTPSAVHDLVRACGSLLDELDGRHVNIGLVEGGTSINTIAPAASCKIDCRDEDEARLHATEDDLMRVLAAAGARVEVIGRRPAGRTPENHPLLGLARAARTAAGLPPAEEVSSSTDANAALGDGIPSVCLGLTSGGGAHTASEYVELEPLRAGASAALTLIETASA